MKKFSERIPGLFTAIVISGFALVGCVDEDDPPDHYVDTPIAGFTYTGNDGPAPVQIQFYNTSLNADKFEWDFGDGGTSNERDPLHTFYNTSGEVKTYLVVLKAIDSTSGLFQRKSKTLAIQPSP